MKSGYTVIIVRDHSRMALDLTELTDSELRVFIASDKPPENGWGGVVFELIKQMRDSDPQEVTLLSDLTEEIRAFERRLAPGSETAQWAEYCEDVRKCFGVLPYDDHDPKIVAPDHLVDYWRDLYEIMIKGA